LNPRRVAPHALSRSATSCLSWFTGGPVPGQGLCAACCDLARPVTNATANATMREDDRDVLKEGGHSRYTSRPLADAPASFMTTSERGCLPAVDGPSPVRPEVNVTAGRTIDPRQVGKAEPLGTVQSRLGTRQGGALSRVGGRTTWINLGAATVSHSVIRAGRIGILGVAQ
jgi:hypothetical protein